MIKRTLGGVGLLTLMLALTSCHTATGGGWIVSPSDPDKKAHFAFSVNCDDVDGAAVVTGSLQYHDQAYTVTAENGNAKKLSIHGLVSGSFFPSTCEGLHQSNESGGQYSGTYVPHPHTLGPGGTFVLRIEDLGQRGPSKGDFFAISLFGGVFDQYVNSGTLGGGQITVGSE